MPDVKAVVRWEASTTAPDCDLSLSDHGTPAAFAAVGQDPYFRQPHG
jgi:hypothetical protein